MVIFDSYGYTSWLIMNKPSRIVVGIYQILWMLMVQQISCRKWGICEPKQLRLIVTWDAHPAGKELRPWKMAIETIGKSWPASGSFSVARYQIATGNPTKIESIGILQSKAREMASLHNRKGDQSNSKPWNIWVRLSFQHMILLGSTYF